MSQFVYFVEDGQTLEKAGLGAFVDSQGVSSLARCNTLRGPSGYQGALLSRGVPSYDPAKQTWRKFSNCWIGFANDDRPNPRSLQRDDFHGGAALVLHDHHPWQFVIAREWRSEDSQVVYYDRLPRLMDIGEDGRWRATGQVVSKYKKLWELTKKSVAIFEDPSQENQDAAFDTICESLALNYWVGPREIAMLGLFDSTLAGVALRKVLDMDSFFELQKKAASQLVSGEPTGSGGPSPQTTDAKQITDPQQVSC